MITELARLKFSSAMYRLTKQVIAENKILDFISSSPLLPHPKLSLKYELEKCAVRAEGVTSL
jgi:hypothetical protein